MKQLILILLFFSLTDALYSQSQNNISTPKGSVVTAYITPELSNSERAYWDNEWSSPNRTYIQYFSDGYSSSGRFNCHGYAWNMSGGGPVRWIGYYVTTDEDVFMTDGSYIKVCNEIYPGKVSWVGGDHSAITTATPGRWISKWNKYPLIEHYKDDTPFGNTYAYYASTKISGDVSNICSGNRTFTVINIPGATYAWTYSSTLSVVGVINTNQITVQRNGSANGAGWVEVQISTPCSGGSVTSRQDVTVGKPLQPQINVSLIDYTVGKIILMTDQIAGVTSYNWYKNGVLHYAHGDVVAIPITRGLCDVSYNIELEAVNSCGISPKRYQTVFVPCEEYFTLSPNPATNEVIISTNKTINEASGNTTFDAIRIYDITGNLKKYQQFSKTTEARIDVTGLPNGNYFIEIINGEFKEKHQLLIHK